MRKKNVAGGGPKYLKNNGPTVIKVNPLFISFHSVKCKSNPRLRWLSYCRSPGSTLSWPHTVPERKDRNVLEVWNSWLQNPLSHVRSCVDDPKVRGVRSRLCLWSRVIPGPLIAGHRHVHCTSKGSGRDETNLRLHVIRQTPRPHCHPSCQTRAVPQAPCSSLAAVLPVNKQKRSSGCKYWSCLFVVQLQLSFGSSLF